MVPVRCTTDKYIVRDVQRSVLYNKIIRTVIRRYTDPFIAAITLCESV